VDRSAFPMNRWSATVDRIVYAVDRASAAMDLGDVRRAGGPTVPPAPPPFKPQAADNAAGPLPSAIYTICSPAETTKSGRDRA
jgi:hypothetical protein